MALLAESTRKKYFEELGLGNYNKTNILKLQKKYMKRKSDWDGIYGKNTDNLLRHVYNCSKVKNFAPEEFRCTCNGKYCCGYPNYMRPIALQHIQKIRDMYGKPITVTCGLRCTGENKACKGSIQNSLHLSGMAIDFYQKGVTDTLANRKASIKKIKVLPNHHYTYGNGINSNGYAVKASYMGNALHTDVAEPAKSTTTVTAPAAEKTWADKAVEWAKSIAADNTWHYVKWNQKVKASQECPICKKHAVGTYHGWNCIGFAYSALAHGAGISMKHSNGVINNAKAEKILSQKTDADATKIVQEALGNKNFKCIKRKAGMPQSLLKAGDICLYFKGSKYQHTFLYIGNGKMIDCTSVSKVANQIAERKALTPKVVIRYTGK